MDSRFHLKLQFEIYGQKSEWDASLNWSAPSGCIDQRIVDWFVCAYENAHAKNMVEQLAAEEERKEIEKRSAEIRQFQMLHLKYLGRPAELP